MTHRPPVIYERIKEIVEDTGLRDGKWDNGGYFDPEPVTGFPGGLDFTTVMEKMVRRYWDRYHDWDRDPRADEHFCQYDVFTHVRDAVLRGVFNKIVHERIQKECAAPGYRSPDEIEREEAARQREAARVSAPGTENKTDINTVRIGWREGGRWRTANGRPGPGECISWVSPEWIETHNC